MKQSKEKNSFLEQSVGEFIKGAPCLQFPPKEILADILNAMKVNHCYSAIIVEDNTLIGLLTEHALLINILSWFNSPVPNMGEALKAFSALKAGDLMIRHPKTIEATLSIDDALNIIDENGYRSMPVVKNGKPMGVLERAQLMGYMEKQSRKELESRDRMLSYLMHHENYGCV